ncbi:glycoside hydrolase family 43 protein [Prevotella sp. PINT]|jgi:Beta-xylosidase|uniref:glycoside hydrolase family 43 protein n=1 Tax=Palleniella intestinalis TaxID=2736291 RepID=UPI001553F953|nr:glycoside hydrolase family 43 protein [Palleniella intestinalis]NPD82012.1 glycoside hydrolase family 43 protein [Palleniella intestinalis]
MSKTPHYLFPADYMADPSANVFNGKLYVYPSHDWESGIEENDNGDHFNMRDYHVFRIDDPDNGEAVDCGLLFSTDDIPWAGRQLWDNDVVEKNGKYYLVFCMKDKTDVFHLGVAVADSPEGPFAIQPDPIRGSYSIDPCVFKDDDGEVYCYFGGIWGGQLQRYDRNGKHLENAHLPEGKEKALPPRVAKMTDDVLQFAHEPKPIMILDENGEELAADNPHRFFEASWMHKYNGKYYYSYSTGDSHYLCYAVGDNPYGPFTYKGVILDPVVGWTTHHSIVEYKGKWYLFHHDSQPSGGRTWLRSMKVVEIEYNEDGTIKKVGEE